MEHDEPSFCPYVGLRPYGEEHREYFFGRAGDIRVIYSTVLAVPLSLLYGASGVGKSSVLLAGVVPKLRLRQGTAVVVFRDWQSPDVLAELKARCIEAASLAHGSQLDVNASLPLDDLLAQTCKAFGGVFVILLDQFEEYFLYHPESTDGDVFDREFARSVNREDVDAGFLLSMREDGLSKLDRFKGRIANLLSNAIRLSHLDEKSAADAIVEPLRVFNEHFHPVPPYSVELGLVALILQQVKSGSQSSASQGHIETPLLQLVMERMWSAEAELKSHALRLETFNHRLGDVRSLLQVHLTRVMETIVAADQALCARFFDHLVTPSGSKLACRLDDLANYSDADEKAVQAVVETLDHKRILRRIDPPPGQTVPSYEIFHDVLAPAVLAWRQQYLAAERDREARAQATAEAEEGARESIRQQEMASARALAQEQELRATAERERAEAERRRADNEARGAKRLRWRSWLAVAASVIAVVLGLLAWHQKNEMTNLATSRNTTNDALHAINLDPARSAHLALKAIDQSPENGRAEEVLRQALATLEIAHTVRIVRFGEPVADARLTADKSRVVVAVGKTVTTLNAQSLDRDKEGIVASDTIAKAWLIAGNVLFVTKTESGTAQVQALDGHTIRPLSCSGDGNSVYSLDVSPDERHIAVGCFNGEMSLWDVAGETVTQQPLLAQGGKDRATVTVLSFSADSAYLASGDTSGNVLVWKLGQSGPWIRTGLIKHKESIRYIGFHRTDSELLVTASDDRIAKVWRLDFDPKVRGLARITKDLPINVWPLSHDRPVVMARFAPRADSTGLLMTVSDKRVYFWEDEKTKQTRSHDDWVIDASVSDDGEYLVSASSDTTARVWSTRFGTSIAVLRGHKDEVSRAFFGPKGQVFTASRDGTLREWALRPPELLVSERKWMLGAAFDADGKRIAVCGERLPTRGNCQVINLVKRPGSEPKMLAEVDEADAVSNVTWSADGKLVAGVRTTHDIFASTKPVIWDGSTGEWLKLAWLDKWRTAAFSPNRPELITVDLAGAVAVWDTEDLMSANPNPKPKVRYAAKQGRWLAAASPDGRWIATIEDGGIALLDRNAAEATPRTLGHKSPVISVRFSGDGMWLVTTSADRTAHVWRVDPPADQPAVEIAGGHGAELSSAAFDHDAKRVATSSADNTVRIWDAHTGHELAALNWHGESVNDVQFEPKGERILTASDDGTVKLGRCEACGLSLVELRNRVPGLAVLTPDEMEGVKTEGTSATDKFKMPTLHPRATAEKPQSRP